MRRRGTRPRRPASCCCSMSISQPACMGWTCQARYCSRKAHVRHHRHRHPGLCPRSEPQHGRQPLQHDAAQPEAGGRTGVGPWTNAIDSRPWPPRWVSRVRNEVPTPAYTVLNLRSAFAWDNGSLQVRARHVLNRLLDAAGRRLSRPGPVGDDQTGIPWGLRPRMQAARSAWPEPLLLKRNRNRHMLRHSHPEPRSQSALARPRHRNLACIWLSGCGGGDETRDRSASTRASSSAPRRRP